MATKLVIGKAAPATYPLKVEVPTPSGLAEINFVAKHLPSTVWATMREEHSDVLEKKVKAIFDEARAVAEAEYDAQHKKAKKGAKAAAAVPEEEAQAQREQGIDALLKPVKGSVLESLRAQTAGDLIAKIVDSWDLDEPMTAASLTEMCDQYPGSSEAVFKAYNETREGSRAKN